MAADVGKVTWRSVRGEVAISLEHVKADTQVKELD